MRKSVLLSFWIFFLSAFALTKEESIDYLVTTYPETRLTDIYKSFYQDNFGPGHLLGDSVSARKYYDYELTDTSEWGGPLFEFTGEGKNFVRVNMDLVRKGIIPVDAYFNAFKNSLGRVIKPTDEYWISEWLQIDSIINAKDYHFHDEEKERKIIREKLKSRDFPIHHSDNFNEHYKFHYRIISLPEFKSLKEKYLPDITISDSNN